MSHVRQASFKQSRLGNKMMMMMWSIMLFFLLEDHSHHGSFAEKNKN